MGHDYQLFESILFIYFFRRQSITNFMEIEKNEIYQFFSVVVVVVVDVDAGLRV